MNRVTNQLMIDLVSNGLVSNGLVSNGLVSNAGAINADAITVASFVVAFGGGLVSFASPCVLPVVPGYLSVITGLDISELEQSRRSNLLPVVRDTALFVVGFGAVFTLLGVSASSLGGLVFDNQFLLARISGALVLAMALFMLGSLYLKAPWLYQEKRFHPALGKYGRAAPTVAGVAFGFGWTPCIGPVLTSILAIAATADRPLTGAALLATYSLGLGIPFLATGLLLGRLSRTLGWVKRHMPTLVLISSLILAVLGLLLLFDRLLWVTTQLQELMIALGLGDLVELG